MNFFLKQENAVFASSFPKKTVFPVRKKKNLVGSTRMRDIWGLLKQMELFYFVVCINFSLGFAAAGSHRDYNSSTSLPHSLKQK